MKDTGGTGHHYYYCYDGSGNVMALLNANQDPVARYDYDAYGNTISTGLVTGEPAVTDATDVLQQNANPYRFSTKRLHAELGPYDSGQTGLYDYGYRFYSPNLGWWINHDPKGEACGVNLYGFVGNDPLNYADRYGLSFGDDDPEWKAIHGEPVESEEQEQNSPALDGGPHLSGMGFESGGGEGDVSETPEPEAKQHPKSMRSRDSERFKSASSAIENLEQISKRQTSYLRAKRAFEQSYDDGDSLNEIIDDVGKSESGEDQAVRDYAKGGNKQQHFSDEYDDDENCY